MSFLRDGLGVFFRCIGPKTGEPQPQFLQGSSDGSVHRAKATTDEGVLWIAHAVQPNSTEPNFFFECVGKGFLDGDTGIGRVGLRPNTQPPFTGTKWRVADLPDVGTHVTLQCEGEFVGSFHSGFLDGSVANAGSLGLSFNLNSPFTQWELILAPATSVGGSEAGGIENAKFPHF
jgi:hypothetical protein